MLSGARAVTARRCSPRRTRHRGCRRCRCSCCRPSPRNSYLVPQAESVSVSAIAATSNRMLFIAPSFSRWAPPAGISGAEQSGTQCSEALRLWSRGIHLIGSLGVVNFSVGSGGRGGTEGGFGGLSGTAAGGNGRSERIRTSGPCVPNTVLYQAELHSDRRARSIASSGARPRKAAGAGRSVTRVRCRNRTTSMSARFSAQSGKMPSASRAMAP